MPYNVSNWLEKNKDPINTTVATLFKNGKGNNLVNIIFSDMGDDSGT